MKNNVLEHMDAQSRYLIDAISRGYLVGGPVRDLLLGKPSLDMDIAIEGNAMIFAQSFAKQHQAKVVTYPAFLTATVTMKDGRAIDFVSTRRETYEKPGAFPVVKKAGIKEDLFRRDFTINAMAIAIDRDQRGALIDPFGGSKDLRAKRIRVLHEKSFIDDPTRILRVARFKCRLGFTVERSTLTLLKEAIKKNAFGTITHNRYLKEYKKILKEPNQQCMLQEIIKWGVSTKLIN